MYKFNFRQNRFRQKSFLLVCHIMSIGQRMNSVIHYDSFVVIRTQCNFVYLFCVVVVQMRSDDLQLSVLFFTVDQCFLVVAVCYCLSDHTLLYSFAFIVLVSVKSFIRIQLCSQSYKFFNLLPAASSLNIPITFLLSPVLISDA